MLLNASYKPHAVRIRGIKIDLSRGQLALSEVEYAKRWNWSRGKVHRFLKELESKTVQQITQQKTNITSVVTIINYDQYQGDDTASDTADGQQVVQQTGSRRAADGHIQEGIRRVEGKEGKELPPKVPKGTGRKPKELTAAEKKRARVQANTPDMVRLGSLFRRRPDSLWNLYEAGALEQILPINESDMAAMQAYYSANIPESTDFRRRNLEQVLNNWLGEVDRANTWKRASVRPNPKRSCI
tara:strand:- start:28 stop:753 length:726 start_codon:yes stop_codon:yes gene_type:complete